MEKEKDEIVFKLDKEQTSKVIAWQRQKGEVYVGAIGGAYTFCFTPTGLGKIIHVKCADGSTLDLTDFDNW